MNTPEWHGSVGLLNAAPTVWHRFRRHLRRVTTALGGSRWMRRDRLRRLALQPLSAKD
jgi:hypothetical protein